MANMADIKTPLCALQPTPAIPHTASRSSAGTRRGGERGLEAGRRHGARVPPTPGARRPRGSRLAARGPHPLRARRRTGGTGQTGRSDAGRWLLDPPLPLGHALTFSRSLPPAPFCDRRRCRQTISTRTPVLRKATAGELRGGAIARGSAANHWSVPSIRFNINGNCSTLTVVSGNQQWLEEALVPGNMKNTVVEERNDAKLQLSREQNARVLQDGILKNHLCKQKEIEISNSHKEEKDLLPKTHLWQDEIAMLRLEIDTINSKNQEMETKYCEDIEIIKEKNVSLLKTIKLKEETLTKTVLEYSGQINALTTENTMLKSKLENEKQNKERLDTQVGSFRARLATALEDYDQSQASKRDLELAFQRAKDEWFRLQDKLNFDVSNLKENNELLSQNLSKAESEFNTLEIELHHTRDALREKTLVLECVQRDLSQTQCQKKEMEHMYQNEQDKVNKYIGKQESLVERLSQLQSENMLLHQQLDDAHNKAASKENVVINIQDQFQDIVKKLQAESEKHGLLLEASNRELINECNLLKERIYQYEKEKVEREVTVRHLQLELADALKKQSMSEASLEVTSRCRINLEDETQDLRKKLGQIRSQVCIKCSMSTVNL
nr:ankyrin repeat domain-containing protein 26 [Mirounga angustirostris]